MTKTKKILIFNPFGIGDVIFSTPLIEMLRENYPDSEIYYICNKRVRDVLRHNPGLKKVFVFEKDEFREMLRRSKIRSCVTIGRFLMDIKRLNADLFIDLSLNFRAALIAKLMGMRRRIGLNYKNRGRFLTGKIDIEGFEGKHVAYHYMDVLKLAGIGQSNCYPKAYVGAEDEAWAENFFREAGLTGSHIVGIIPGGGRSWGADSRYRRWPVSNFAHLTDKILGAYDCRIMVLGDESEKPLCDNIQKLMKGSVVNAGGRTTVGQFMALLKRCEFVVCNEGGPLHIAVALDVPTVSIFGPVDEKVYGPLSADPDMHIVVSQRLKCSPCYSKFKHTKCELIECINSLTVEKMYGAVLSMMENVKRRKYERAK